MFEESIVCSSCATARLLGRSVVRMRSPCKTTPSSSNSRTEFSLRGPRPILGQKVCDRPQFGDSTAPGWELSSRRNLPLPSSRFRSLHRPSRRREKQLADGVVPLRADKLRGRLHQVAAQLTRPRVPPAIGSARHYGPDGNATGPRQCPRHKHQTPNSPASGGQAPHSNTSTPNSFKSHASGDSGIAIWGLVGHWDLVIEHLARARPGVLTCPRICRAKCRSVGTRTDPLPPKAEGASGTCPRPAPVRSKAEGGPGTCPLTGPRPAPDGDSPGSEYRLARAPGLARLTSAGGAAIKGRTLWAGAALPLPAPALTMMGQTGHSEGCPG